MTDTAICHFCGQAFMLKEDKAEKEAEAYALSVCTCAQARQFRLKESQIQQAQAKLAEIFNFSLTGKDESAATAGLENLLETLYKIVEEGVNGNVRSVNMQIPDVGSLSIKIDSNGKVKIKKSLTLSYGSEV